MFKSIPKSDITIRPFKVYKNWTLNDTITPITAVRNLTGSFEDLEGYTAGGFNEMALYKSIKQLFYSNAVKQIGTVTNWDLVNHKAKKIKKYDVRINYNLSTPIETSYSYYYDNDAKQYIDEFQQFLDSNGYIVNDTGIILSGKWTNISTLYGKMENYGSVQERVLGDRFLMWSIPQRYIGEEIKPGTFIITDYSNTNPDGTYSKIVDDGYSNLVYLGKNFVEASSFDFGEDLGGGLFSDATFTITTSDGLNYVLDLVEFNMGDEEAGQPGYFSVTYQGGSPFQTQISSYDLMTGTIFTIGNLNLPTALSQYNISTKIGNIFYSNGIVLLTYGTSKYDDTSVEQSNYNFGSDGNWDIRFQSTKTIFENEVFLEVDPNEFNYSTNPSATTYYNGEKYINKYIPFKPASLDYTGNAYDLDFRITSNFDGVSKLGFDEYEYSSSLDPTGSYLAPYITTIGLYDENYDMVAVAKVPSKPKSLPDYPVNFVVRFDT
jgi:hypothetical protein